MILLYIYYSLWYVTYYYIIILIDYLFYEDFENIGIEFYKNGTNNYNETTETIEINNDNFLNYIINDKLTINCNVTFNPTSYFQTKEFAIYIRNYLLQDAIKSNIINKNEFNIRYNNNNDVYIHVRLGDSIKYNPGFEYYDSILSKLSYTNGYISSDTINHDICQKLINKYNLKIIICNEIQTIKFGSTCKYIILSNGTFSWFIGVLSFFSIIYFPKIKYPWHGNIFVFNDWNEIY